MWEGRCWLKSDPRPTIAERQIGGMTELQGLCQIESRTQRYHAFVIAVRMRQSRPEVDTRAGLPLRAYGSTVTVSLLAGVPTMIFSPIEKPRTLRTLIFVTPAFASADRLV